MANCYLTFPTQGLETLISFREWEVKVIWVLPVGMEHRLRPEVSCPSKSVLMTVSELFIDQRAVRPMAHNPT
jgi:hypothetical protein